MHVKCQNPECGVVYLVAHRLAICGRCGPAYGSPLPCTPTPGDTVIDITGAQSSFGGEPPPPWAGYGGTKRVTAPEGALAGTVTTGRAPLLVLGALAAIVLLLVSFLAYTSVSPRVQPQALRTVVVTVTPTTPASSPPPPQTGGETPRPRPVPSDYLNASRQVLVSADSVMREVAATARSIWKGYPASRASTDFQRQHQRFVELRQRVGLLVPPAEQAARHQRLIRVLDLASQMTEELAYAGKIEAQYGLPRAKPYWNAELQTLEAYRQARGQL